MNNIEIRTYAMQNGVKLYEVAKALRVSDSTMTLIMRRDLTAEKKQEIMTIIDQIAEAKQHGQ